MTKHERIETTDSPNTSYVVYIYLLEPSGEKSEMADLGWAGGGLFGKYIQ